MTVRVIAGGKQNTKRTSPTNFITYIVVLSTPRHERDSKSQLQRLYM